MNMKVSFTKAVGFNNVEGKFGYIVLLSCMQLLKANTKLRGILIINKLVSFTNALSMEIKLDTGMLLNLSHILFS